MSRQAGAATLGTGGAEMGKEQPAGREYKEHSCPWISPTPSHEFLELPRGKYCSLQQNHPQSTTKLWCVQINVLIH